MTLARLRQFHRVAKCGALKMKMLLEEHAGHMALAQRCLPKYERKTWFPEHLKLMRSARRCLATLKKLVYHANRPYKVQKMLHELPEADGSAEADVGAGPA